VHRALQERARFASGLAAFATAFPLALALAGCSSKSGSAPTADAGADAAATSQGLDMSDQPLAGLTHDDIARFNDGDVLFNARYREADGLGPLYIRTGSGACHAEVSRGPGLVQKMSVVLGDGFTASPDQSKLPFGHTVMPLLAAGAKTPIVAPPGDPSVKVTVRIGPPLMGHGYMEAVADSEIERLEREQAARGSWMHGRINRVTFTSEANADTRFHSHQKGETGLIGRFGLKARNATLDDFIAGALLGDIGITSPMRPTEVTNPDALEDDAKPGVDVSIDRVNAISFYVRTLAIPPRTNLTPQGEALFAKVGCASCHVPVLKTRADYPIAALAGVDAPVFTDFLLHDMGTDLADGVPGDSVDGQATSREWRTGALIGLRFSRTFMHDGRAKNIEEAILLHDGPGSEASPCIDLFRALPPDEQSVLVHYTEAL
jgi:CxxC motif-containing protein (DUF1111 family)